jgi:hypothetical protein
MKVLKREDSECVKGIKVAQDRRYSKDFCDYCDESESSTEKAKCVYKSRKFSY